MPQRDHAAFREAVLDLSDEPTPTNVLRYLAASRKLASTTAAERPARRPRRAKAQKTHV